MNKDGNPIFINVMSMVFFVFVFGWIYSIWTNFIPNRNVLWIARICGVLFSTFWGVILFIGIDDKTKLFNKVLSVLCVVVISYVVAYYSLSYSIPSIATCFLGRTFQDKYMIVDIRERKLPLMDNPDCPYKIYVKSPHLNDNRKNKVCIAYNQLSSVTVGQIVLAAGRESQFGR